MRIKELFSARDMTQGKPWQRIAEFAFPMLLGNFAQQLYNTADSVIVGEYVGDNALAAVGSAMPILNLLLAIFVGVSTGAGIVIAQHYGARDREGLSLAVGNCLTLAAIASLVIMLIGPLIAKPFLELLGTPDSIINWCADYLNIMFWGILGFFFYNMLSGVLRGLGDSLSALIFLLISAALNVALDLLFVAKFGLGVPGVAIATVIAQVISAVLCYWKLTRMQNVFDLAGKYLKLESSMAMRIIRIGLPSGITQGIMAGASMVVQSLTNSMGEMFIACNVIVMRVDGFAMLPNLTFGQAMSVYTGQNVGANKLQRVHQGTKQGSIMALVVSAVITGALLLFGRYLFDIFTDTQELIELAVKMMRVLAVGYICVSVSQVLGGVMRGAGDTMTPMWISLISTIVLRVPTAYIMAHFTKSPDYPNGHPISIFTSLLVSWSLGMVITLVVYRIGKWKKKMYASAEQYIN